MIPYGRQSISDADVSAVVDVMRSDFLTSGPKVSEFEEAFADMCGASYAVSCSNGTAGLHLAMLAAGVGEGDRVITTPNTFLASANAGKYVGAEVEFRDVEPVAATLNAASLEEHWKEDTKAVVSVDYAGHPADLERIGSIAHSNGAVLIEDACHSIGGRFFFNSGESYRVGGFPWVDMAVFSFHPVKTMTTGEGGMVVTNNPEFAEKVRLLRNHGMVRDPELFSVFGNDSVLDEPGPWAYEMAELGFNYRLTDLQCALGLSQLKRLDEFIQRRAEIASRYNRAFDGLELLRAPRVAEWVDPASTISWHLYSVRIDFESLGMSRSQFMQNLRERGVGSQVHYIPVSSQPFYRRDDEASNLPVAESLYQRCLSLPLYPELTDSEVDTVIAVVSELVDEKR